MPNKKTNFPKKLLNIPQIQNDIRIKHQKFIRDFGLAAEKVMADHSLLADQIMAKLHRIVLLFREEHIIDDIKIDFSGPCKIMEISKLGNYTRVDLTTNGSVILLEGSTYNMSWDKGTDFQWPKERFLDVNNDEFDWVNFSSKLLDYIHKTIYDRKEAAEAKLEGMLQIVPEDIPIKSCQPKKKSP
jgi:hypothetical protein